MLSQRQHLLGIALLLLSISWLFILPWLPLNAHRSISADLLPHNHGQYALVFFGFPGCTDICPTSLHAMATLARQYRTSASVAALELVFINLMTVLPADTAQTYAHHIHPDFIVYPASNALLAAFGAMFQGNEQTVWQHSGYIYLLEKVSEIWQIHYVYRNPQELQENALNHIKTLQK